MAAKKAGNEVRLISIAIADGLMVSEKCLDEFPTGLKANTKFLILVVENLLD